MKKVNKKIITSMLIILVFFSLFIPKANANFFTDDDNNDKKEDSKIEKAIDDDDGGIFEKIIAKMIGGLAEAVFDLTTNEDLGVGFKDYDELIFAQNSTDISPFTTEQWNSMMNWYKIMATVSGSLILIAVVVVAYKLIISGYSIEKRNEAKDSLMRLFFGAVSIAVAPLFVKFLLILNNNLVRILVGYSTGSLDELLGNSVITNIRTGNAIATAIVIALFAYLFFKLNVKFIIRQFTILVFTLFTPIIAIMWMINKRTIGAAIWFGQILINVFMQFIYAFLFLIYLEFLPQAGGWATSILWAMMILPIADALQNTLQNLISRIAGINNENLANRGIGMAGAMAHSIRTIAYQFKGNDSQNNIGGTSFVGRMLNKNSGGEENKITPMETKNMETTTMKTKSMNTNSSGNLKVDAIKELGNKSEELKRKVSPTNVAKKAFNTGKEFMNMGMYMAEGRNFKQNREFGRYNINNSRKEDFKNNKKEENVITNLEEQDKV